MIICRFEDGVPYEFRHAVVGTIVTRDSQILLVRRAPTMRTDPGRLALPGGYMNRDESLLEAARRETKEETGYDITLRELFWITDRPEPRNDHQNIVIYFLAELASDAPPTTHDHETSEVVWLSFDQLPPSDEFAFNHGEILERYRRWLTERTPLPLFSQRVQG